MLDFFFILPWKCYIILEKSLKMALNGLKNKITSGPKKGP